MVFQTVFKERNISLRSFQNSRVKLTYSITLFLTLIVNWRLNVGSTDLFLSCLYSKRTQFKYENDSEASVPSILYLEDNIAIKNFSISLMPKPKR